MRKPLSNFIKCLVLTLLFVTILPSNVLAENTIYAYSGEGENRKNYYSIQEAMNASRTGVTVVMNVDWFVNSPIDIVEGTTSKIEMNGHKIQRNASGKKSDGHVFLMHARSKLYLYGNGDPDHSFNYDYSGNNYNFNSGGLVCGGSSSDGGGIYMKKSAELHIENVTIAFNRANNGGGIYVDGQDCQIYMDKKAIIEYNSADGSGIYSDADGTHIHINGNSEIRLNNTLSPSKYGGGVYFNKSWFSIESEDKTGAIRNNRVTSKGAGIYVCSKFWGSNNGTIKGLTIENNESHGSGGGLYLDQNNTTIETCVIKNNSSSSDGAGIYSNGKNTISNSTIMYNRCNQAATINGNREGGGVYAASGYDIKITGSTVIRGNQRMNPNTYQWWNPDAGDLDLGDYVPGHFGYSDDDVFLGGSSVYILANGLDASTSLIGIRTGNLSDRVVVKNFNGFSWGHTFFFNLANDFHFGTANNDTELWQRKGVDKYTLRVNGKSVGTYNFGDTVKVSGSSKTGIFNSWSCNGLDLTDTQKRSSSLEFKMPAYDVELTATYTTSGAEEAILTVSAPVVGSDLYALGKLNWTINKIGYTSSIPLTWYEKDGDNYKEVTGTAKANTAYMVKITAGKDGSKNMIFDGLKIENVKVIYETTKDQTTKYAASATVDSNGTLNVQGFDITSVAGTYNVVNIYSSIKVEEGTSKEDLIKALPTLAKATNSLSKTSTIDVSLDASNTDVSALLSEGKVAKPASGNKYTINVPIAKKEGLTYNCDSVTVTVYVTDKSASLKSVVDTSIEVEEGTDAKDIIKGLKEAYTGKATLNSGDTTTVALRYLTNANLTKKFKEIGLVDNDGKAISSDNPYEFTRDVYALAASNINVGDVKAKFIVIVKKKDDISNNQNIVLTSLEDQILLVDETYQDDDVPTVKSNIEENVYSVLDVNKDKITVGENDLLSLNVTLSIDDIEDITPTIKYVVYSENADNTYIEENKGTYTSPIVLSATKGSLKSYIIKTWFEVDDEVSDEEYYAYTVDNTICLINVYTNLTDNNPDNAKPYKTLIYNYGDTNINIALPIIEGYKYNRHDSLTSEIKEHENDEYLLTVTSLTKDVDITTYYYPTITKLTIENASLNVGDSLPTISKVTATLSNGTTTDVTEYFDLNNINWNENDTSVQYDTLYVATLNTKNNDKNLAITETYILGDDVILDDENSGYTTYVYQNEGESIYHVDFIFDVIYDGTDTSISYNLKSINDVNYPEISYEQALSLNKVEYGQDLGYTIVDNYNLPAKVSVNLEGGLEDSLAIEWNNYFTTSFDPNNYDVQELVIEGTLIKPDYIKADNFNNKITLRIKVKAKQGYIPNEVIEESTNKAITCEEYMKSKDWTWSESKKACVYKVSNTGSN